MNLLISTNYNISEEKWSILIKYGDTIKAVTLERITRLKYFPSGEFFGRKNYYKIFLNGVKKLIKGLNVDEIGEIVTLNFPFSLETLFKNKEIKYIECKEHHLLHAFSTFYSSGYEESSVLVIDGAGYEEKYKKEICYSIWKFDKKGYKNLYLGEIKKDKYKLGIGYIYALHTLLFKIGEGAIMGLSSYGDKKIHKEIDLFGEDYFLKENYRDIFKENENRGNNFQDLEKIIKEIYGIKDEIIDKDFIHKNYKDIAARLQYCTENVILNLAKKSIELSKSKNLCIAGGVGLNIIGNTLIYEKNITENIFVEPACDDSGLSLGGIYYLQHINKDIKINNIQSYGLGEEFDNNEIEKDLIKYKKYLKYEKKEDIFLYTAKLLSEGKIIGFFQGGGELGPRALGFRSILARPDSVRIRNKINEIKKREYWRPLAPVILEEELEKYFKTSLISPFMLFNAKIRKKMFKNMLGVSHVDFTARYQTLNKFNNKYLYNLLQKFYKITDIPILINTSFNQHNEPIVETPKEAIEMFLSTKLDYLVLGDYLVSKQKVFKEFVFSKEKSYEKLFNYNKVILEKLNTIILKDIKPYNNYFEKGKIYYKNDKDKFSIYLTEYNVIGNKKNILINFESKLDKKEEEKIIENIINNKKQISKLLVIYYNDFLNDEDVLKINISYNNFKL